MNIIIIFTQLSFNAKGKKSTGEKHRFGPLFCSKAKNKYNIRGEYVLTCPTSQYGVDITVIFHFEKNEITNDQFKENIFHCRQDV